MSPTDDETLVETRPDDCEGESVMEERANEKDIELTADLQADGKTIVVTGPGLWALQVNEPPCKFKFELDDNGLGVNFDSLDTADGLACCPPPKSGNKSSQIDDSDIHIQPQKASFKDKNDNNSSDGVLLVSYQWNFTCSDPEKTVLPFDPIIANGGKSTGLR